MFKTLCKIYIYVHCEKGFYPWLSLDRMGMSGFYFFPLNFSVFSKFPIMNFIAFIISWPCYLT